MNFDDELDVGWSEFEDAYEDEPSQDLATFTEDMLEEPLEMLQRRAPVCVGPDALIADVVAGMSERNQGCVLVESEDKLIGIFTERDVIRRVMGKVDPATTPVSQVMTRDPEAASFHDTMAVALNKMTVGGFRHVPLVDIQRRPLGVISVKDIVHFLVAHFHRRVLNVAPDPALRNPDDVAGAG